ncbi:MAG: hypothetical protein HYV62_15070, partial [Candidatus Rokubacteria bacterium]|nr:hypothetical protein [Candidatus Rokubacteria bacterium]
ASSRSRPARPCAAERPTPARRHVLFAGGGDEGSFAAPADAAGPLDVLLIAGVALGEPVARYGPFVMNTGAKIRPAPEDYPPAASAGSARRHAGRRQGARLRGRGQLTDRLLDLHPALDLRERLVRASEVLQDLTQHLGDRRALGPEVLGLALEVADLLPEVVHLVAEPRALLLGRLELLAKAFAVVEERRDHPTEQVLAFLDPPVDSLPLLAALHHCPLLSGRSPRARPLRGFDTRPHHLLGPRCLYRTGCWACQGQSRARCGAASPGPLNGEKADAVRARQSHG